MEVLLAHGADCDRANVEGRSPLMYAARISKAAVNILLRAKANVHAKNKTGSTVLRFAAEADAQRKPLGIVKSLIRAGADIGAVSFDGVTALQGALDEGNEDVANYLIACGADITYQDTCGNNSLCYAVQSNCHSITKLL